MGVAYSIQATVFRSTNFDREVFRSLGTSSVGARDEFCTSVNLTDADPPSLPLDIATPGMTSISFLVVSVTGGKITLTLAKGNNTFDMEIQGLMILSGSDITGITITDIVSGNPFVEVFGMGA
jgi:hypothetical protein